RHGASDWETASGGLGSSWKGGSGFVRATADATKRVPPKSHRTRQSAFLPTFDFRLSDLRLSWFSHAAERPSQSAGSGHGHAAGLAVQEACFCAAADTPQNAHATFRQCSKFGAVAP
ncbi:MAG: hypothetical protein ILM98_03815, partial [Kiritimatiellae bacterium]|nr:hypothetical protein [Kiritimatiellia bacterium]